MLRNVAVAPDVTTVVYSFVVGVGIMFIAVSLDTQERIATHYEAITDLEISGLRDY